MLLLLRPGSQHRTGRGLGQALPSPCRVPGTQGAGGTDPDPRGTADPLADACRQQEIGTARHATLRPSDRRLESDQWRADDLN
ncbi:hypothetical protein [Nitrosomonas sp.]|uniref:hypothetical protein n=1 Tax=Nitrosomonas sp. TaxID=42353 RepID=UPI002621A507|nr:hypothetical protein [Nitrosomonas sp.]MCW5600025.1 hypothetical protein [Nitrosomonas sp.]